MRSDTARSQSRVRTSRRYLAVTGVSLLLSCAWMRSSVNDSPGLRWWLFSNFGASEVCPRVLESGAPLRLTSNGPIIGRFFPNRCQQQMDDTRQTMTLDFGGTGFAWTAVAGRIGFAASARVEYRMDFRLTEDAIYVWGVPANAQAQPTFQLGAIENAVVNWAAHGPASYLSATFGGQILSSQLAQGFTVIRSDEGDEFSLGHLEPPARPPRPFALSGDDRIVLANDTSEVHKGQFDIAGPFQVSDDDQALYFQFRTEGPAFDALLYPRTSIDPWREGIQTGASLAPPPISPSASFVVQPGITQPQAVPLRRGSYVLIMDNSDRLGQTKPPFNPLDLLGAGTVTVSYAVQLGDAP